MLRFSSALEKVAESFAFQQIKYFSALRFPASSCAECLQFTYAAILTFTSPFCGVPSPPHFSLCTATGLAFMGSVWVCSSGMGSGEAHLVPPCPRGVSCRGLYQPAQGRMGVLVAPHRPELCWGSNSHSP